MNNNIILNKEENLKDINSTIKDIQNLFDSIEIYIIPNITIRNTANKIVNIVGELTKLVDIVTTSKELVEQANAVIYASVSGTSSGKTGGKESDCGSDSCDGCDSCDSCDYCDCSADCVGDSPCGSDCASDGCSSDCSADCVGDSPCGSDCASDGCSSDCSADCVGDSPCGSDCASDGCSSDCSADSPYE